MEGQNTLARYLKYHVSGEKAVIKALTDITNENKKVIAPKKWFGPPLDKRNDTSDLYCDGWIVI